MSDKLTYSYDNYADILYLSKGEPVPCLCREGYGGLILRYTYDELPSAVTIIDFQSAKTDPKVTLEICKFLEVNKEEVEFVFNSAN